ncbi:MAG: hypothetical protein E6J56_25825 [Deltaproteobacteria bacterium]|nr:MAG: hypothetical protein E6J56_25825 [Deltaproteobacteria bacterium]
MTILAIPVESATMYIHRMARMVRKQLYLSREQNERLRRAARRLRRTEADLLREALDRHLGDRRGTASIGRDPLWAIVGVAASPRGNLSGRIDEHLYGARRR